MEAPDKIYVDTDLIAFHIMNERLNDGDVEYIRKDALLEWAKKEQYDSTTLVADDFWQKVIDKINSL